MDAHDHQLIGIFLFEFGEIGERVDAIDAAKSPEVEDNDLAAEVGQLQRTGRIEPVGSTLELGRGYAPLLPLVRGIAIVLALGRHLLKGCGFRIFFRCHHGILLPPPATGDRQSEHNRHGQNSQSGEFIPGCSGDNQNRGHLFSPR